MKLRLTFLYSICVALAFNGFSSADMEQAQTYLSANAETAYMTQGGNGLIPADLMGRQYDNTVVLQKTIDGIPLHGGRVFVVFGDDGQVTEVVDYSSQNLKLEIGKPKLDADLAQWTANASMKKVRALANSTQLVWFRTGDNAEIAWEVNSQLEDTGQPVSPTNLVTVVDAETGEILSQSQYDTKDYYNDLNADIFPRIVINDGIGPAGSRAYAASFDSTVSFTFGCTGVLIAPNRVLCARHCSVFSGDQIRFGTNSNNPTFSINVQSTFLPDGGGSLLDGGDVVICRLNGNVPANVATPMRLIDATNDLVDMVCAMTGYGWNGVGSQGHNFNGDGRRWGGENIIDRYGSPAGAGGSNIISTDFDNGSNGANTIPGSDRIPIEFEATTAPGDSGGPVMVQLNGEWLVAGVLSGGTSSTSVYGDISWWTGTAEYRTQIENEGGEFADEKPVFLGDINCDGAVNLLDINPFVALVSTGTYFEKADINVDGSVNLLDISGFIDLLNGN